MHVSHPAQGRLLLGDPVPEWGSQAGGLRSDREPPRCPEYCVSRWREGGLAAGTADGAVADGDR
ncbi:MAG: hypothetical protein JWP46_1411 [Modestobacter sp.]|nr:hypothetical protein [Modestobacter sp.]